MRRMLGMIAVLLSALLTAACGSDEPTLAAASNRLTADLPELMNELSDYITDVQTIASPDRNVPCGEKKARRTFAAFGKLRETTQQADAWLDALDDGVAGAFTLKKYRWADRHEQADNAQGRYLTFSEEDSGVSFQVVIRLDPPVMSITAQTPCLPE